MASRPSGPCRALAISPDGKTLATGGDGKVVKLWDLAAARERATLTGHDGPITCVAFAPDGTTLATGSRDSSVTLWDVASAKERANLARHTSAVTCVHLHPTATRLPPARSTGLSRFGMYDRAWFVTRSKDTRGAIKAIAISPDGMTLASTSVDGTIRLWEVVSGLERAAIRAHSGLGRAAGVPE